jgi:hypothetical protein
MKKNTSSCSPADESFPIPTPSPQETTNHQSDDLKEPAEPKKAESEPKPLPWHLFVQKASDTEIRDRFTSELHSISAKHGSILQNYNTLILFEPWDDIGPYELDQIYNALSTHKQGDIDILLILLSRGGNIEPAYQISKLSKSYSKNRFIVAIPRQGKSAATLIALGADEIHIGPLGQLGPIDPQLGGLPALGVTQALKTIASLSQNYPGSADMFAKYLRTALTVEQIGYCDRVSESAVQYAERLLSTKPALPANPSEIAKKLVYEYKDHGFVIDLLEAQKLLGDNWVKTATPELDFAEDLYRQFDLVNLFLNVRCSKKLLLLGGLTSPVVIIFQIEKT